MIEAMSTIPTQVLPMPVFSAITSPYLERFDRQDEYSDQICGEGHFDHHQRAE
jgi:hypothetical protein